MDLVESARTPVKVSWILTLLTKVNTSTAKETRILYDEAVKLNAKIMIDLGVGSYAGTTKGLLLACITTEGHVWSVDVKNHLKARESVDVLGLSKYWTYVIMDDLEFVKRWEPWCAVDIVVIDTTHTYEQTLKELEAYAPLVRVGGLIFLHDTKKDLSFRGVPYGVWQAIPEFLSKHSNWKYSEYDTRFGFGRLEKLEAENTVSHP